MHITCIICSDLFTPSADIYSTPCGHIFHYTCLLHWLENSKTCPQCRTKVSSKSLIRLYVNVATSQGLEADVTILQHKLDSVEFSMKLKDQEIKNIAIKNRETKEQNKSLRKQIAELELAEKRYESVVAAHKEQIKYFKGRAQVCDKLQSEIANLKNEVKNLENIQIAVNGSRKQVEDIIRNENNVENLALLTATLKKSLVDSDRANKELQFEVKKSRNELSQHKRKIAEMKCEYEDTKRQLDSLKLNYEREVAFLKDKFSQLQDKVTTGVINESLSTSLRRITSESPVNYNRTPVLSGQRGGVVDLTPDTPPCSATSQSEPDGKNDDAVIVPSPLPASSMGLFGIQRTKMLKSNSDQNKFSIFKSKHPALLESHTTRSKGPDIAYNGLGGSSKEDIYPSPSGIKRPKTSKMSSSKFKKLSADAGKSNRKVSEFLNNS